MRESLNGTKKVLVGLSGGVDSAVCAWFLKKEGCEVIGVHFLISGDASLEKTKRIAKHLEMPLLVEDISKEFHNEVVDDFIKKYSMGETPNPCVICNRKLKYKKLIELADKQNVEKVATGHYARVVAHGGKFSLLKGKDSRKDQSYFLYRLNQKQLSRILLPLGEMTKSDVKKIAEKEEIPVEGGESQDVCFFAKQESLSEFLEKYFNGHSGEIVDENNRKLGKHQGAEFFTIGQRKGLNIGGDGPYYVFEKNREKAQIKVTSNHDHPSLLFSEIKFGDATWVCGAPQENVEYQIKTRYQMKGSVGKIIRDKSDSWRAILNKPQWAVAKGQSLVIFDGDKVLGGGLIK